MFSNISGGISDFYDDHLELHLNIPLPDKLFEKLDDISTSHENIIQITNNLLVELKKLNADYKKGMSLPILNYPTRHDLPQHSLKIYLNSTQMMTQNSYETILKNFQSIGKEYELLRKKIPNQHLCKDATPIALSSYKRLFISLANSLKPYVRTQEDPSFYATPTIYRCPKIYRNNPSSIPKGQSKDHFLPSQKYIDLKKHRISKGHKYSRLYKFRKFHIYTPDIINKKKGQPLNQEQDSLTGYEIHPKGKENISLENTHHIIVVPGNGQEGLNPDFVEYNLPYLAKLNKNHPKKKFVLVATNYRGVDTNIHIVTHYNDIVIDTIAQAKRLIDAGIPANNIVYFGESLGGFAVNLATHYLKTFEMHDVWCFAYKTFSEINKVIPYILPKAAKEPARFFENITNSILQWYNVAPSRSAAEYFAEISSHAYHANIDDDSLIHMDTSSLHKDIKRIANYLICVCEQKLKGSQSSGEQNILTNIIRYFKIYLQYPHIVSPTPQIKPDVNTYRYDSKTKQYLCRIPRKIKPLVFKLNIHGLPLLLTREKVNNSLGIDLFVDFVQQTITQLEPLLTPEDTIYIAKLLREYNPKILKQAKPQSSSESSEFSEEEKEEEEEEGESDDEEEIIAIIKKDNSQGHHPHTFGLFPQRNRPNRAKNIVEETNLLWIDIETRIESLNPKDAYRMTGYNPISTIKSKLKEWDKLLEKRLCCLGDYPRHDPLPSEMHRYKIIVLAKISRLLKEIDGHTPRTTPYIEACKKLASYLEKRTSRKGELQSGYKNWKIKLRNYAEKKEHKSKSEKKPIIPLKN